MCGRRDACASLGGEVDSVEVVGEQAGTWCDRDVVGAQIPEQIAPGRIRAGRSGADGAAGGSGVGGR